MPLSRCVLVAPLPAKRANILFMSDDAILHEGAPPEADGTAFATDG